MSQQVPLRFVSTGYGFSVCANRVLAVLVPESAPSKRCLIRVRDAKLYIDMTSGHAVRSLLLLDDGQVVGCAMTPKTMLARLNANDSFDMTENDEE